jgi:hypothetical protein
MVIQALASFLSLLNIKEDLYALGNTAQLVCEKLINAPRTNSATADPKPASLIIIDRVCVDSVIKYTTASTVAWWSFTFAVHDTFVTDTGSCTSVLA